MGDGITLGTLVDHTKWGLGKVVEIDAPFAWVQFSPQRTTSASPPEIELKLEELTKASVQSDPHLDHIPARLRKPDKNSRGKKGKPVGPRPAQPRPTLHTLDQAITWFQIKYPKLFRDPKLIDRELGYKRKAHAQFVDLFGGGKGRRLLRLKKLPEIASGLNRLYHATNIPSRFELMAANDGLKDGAAAARLLSALLDFVESPDGSTFDDLTEAVGSLPAPAEGSRVLTWPNVTILPFLADPASLMVLKPKITKRMARRLQFSLLYSSSPTWHCY